MDSDLDQWIKAALLEVERNLDLPTNSLVDEVMLKPVDVKPLQVRLKKNFMATVPDYRIRHSRFARMQKRIAEQDILIGELISTLTSALEGWLIHPQKNGSFRSHHLGKSQWPNSLHIFAKIAPKLLLHSLAHINSLTYIHYTETLIAPITRAQNFPLHYTLFTKTLKYQCIRIWLRYLDIWGTRLLHQNLIIRCLYTLHYFS